jgi:hypothetical protein
LRTSHDQGHLVLETTHTIRAVLPHYPFYPLT